jgi:hypothetical protein
MSSSYPANPTASPQLLFRSAGCRADQPFGSVLTEADFQELSQRHWVYFGQGPDCVYNPVLTVWAFLSQCLNSTKDCFTAVTRVIALRIACSLPICSNATGAYCLARGKLPASFLRDLAYRVGDRLEEQAPQSWLWKSRRCVTADGTTVSGPDTKANQKTYPQSKSQKPGLGFPLIRLVVLLGLATGALLGALTAPWHGQGNGEPSLLRRLLDRLRPGDILLYDAGNCSFWTVALALQRGIDVVIRLKEASWSKASAGKRLGKGDYEVVWSKPRKRPEWMDEATYQSLPETMTLREIHTTVSKPGFRTQKVIVITTLLDSELYPAEDIGELYRQRWHVELDIRNIKTWMKMDILTGQTPAMLEREIWTHLLMYNLIRRLQAVAACQRGCHPRQLSFTAAKRQLEVNWEKLGPADEEKHRQHVRACVRGAGSRRVGNRPDRYEPRRVKRRPKDCKRLSKPRPEARADVLAGKEARETKKRRGAAARGKAAAATAR